MEQRETRDNVIDVYLRAQEVYLRAQQASHKVLEIGKLRRAKKNASCLLEVIDNKIAR